ncbi:hypothetical protein LguiB_020956 [Lonicera macranthoides]
MFVHISNELDPENPPDDDPSDQDPLSNDPRYMSVTRDDFPKDFIFGTSSAAYQFEGAAREDDKIKDGSNGDIAEDFYHRYPEDLRIMQYLGFNAFRFSISWPRILPCQEPFATIFQWDLPQALEKQYMGFLNGSIVDDFREYADLCFSLFGDRVKNWITINEPWRYNQGIFPPNRCTKGTRLRFDRPRGFTPGRFTTAEQEDCREGNSGTEPYIVSHNLILSHAAAVKVYREKYQGGPKASLAPYICHWIRFMAPLSFGHYPRTMVERLGERLPDFTDEQSEMLKGSADFIGLNYYTAKCVAATRCIDDSTYTNDPCAYLSSESAAGEAIGNKTYLEWLYVYPEGIKDILRYGQRMYNNPVIYITENGGERRRWRWRTANEDDDGGGERDDGGGERRG